MKTTLDKLEGLTHKLSIEVTAEKVRDAFDKAYKGLQKTVSLKGFRKGKVPLNVIRRHYSDKVKQDVLQNLIFESYQAALDKHSLAPVGDPNIKFDHFDNNKDFAYSAEFEVYPEINPTKYEGLNIEQEKVEIGNEQVENALKSIQADHSEVIPLSEDRPAQKGDTVEIAFKGFIDGQPLENASSENYILELGSKEFIEGFEEGIIGMIPGTETTLNLMFSKEYHDKKLAGKPVEFKIKLNGLKKKLLPELNDTLAKNVGDFDSLDALKAQIRKNLEASEKQKASEDLKNKILRALVDANPVEVPKHLHKRQKAILIKDLHQRMTHQGLSKTVFEEYKEKLDNDFSQSASYIVQASFLVDVLANKLGLRPTTTDFEAKITEIAQQSGLEEGLLKEHYLQQKEQSRLNFQIMEEKVVAYLIEKANIKQVPKKPD